MALLTLERASALRPTVVEWLWPGRLARGKLAILDGDPEVGKSLLTLDLAARLTRGGPMPDGASLSRSGTAVLLSAEDDRADTVLPRVLAAGADPERLVLPDARAVLFPADQAALEGLIREVEADLVVIDPLMAFLPPSAAANVDQCVRVALTPLSDLAARTGCAILFVRHLRKQGHDRALFRGLGSVGIGAAVRTALLAGEHPTEPGLRVLATAKNNLDRRPVSLGYRVAAAEGQPRIEWTGPVDLTAEALYRKPPAVLPARDRAVEWLRRELAAGPRKAADVQAAAAAAGIPDATLKRAKKDLGADSQRVYDYKAKQGEWYWYDPDGAWPKETPFRRPTELSPLEPL